MQASNRGGGGKSGRHKPHDNAPSRAALDFIHKARNTKPNGSRWPTTDELIEWNALEVVSIHMVYTEADLVNAKRTFRPKLAHQIFGQKEMMSGYIFPRIHLYFLANSAKCFLKFLHEGLSNRQTDIGNARLFDNLIGWLPDDYFVDRSKFVQAIKSENHTKMFGSVISEFEVNNTEENSRSKFILRDCTIEEPGFAEFHARFQCLIVWYIDAASPLDLEDTNWMFVYVYEEVHPSDSTQPNYYPVGYCAIYKFFHYPDKIRTRISQCFVLPCCQRMGIGSKLLIAAYQMICNLPNAVDITVEDPCPAFQRLRDYVDSMLLKDLDSFRYDELKNGCSKQMIDDANNIYKLNKRQCRRVYHILHMAYLSITDDKDENTTLLKDIHTSLGISQQDEELKPHYKSGSSRMREAAQSSHAAKMSSTVDLYINEIRPVAWRIRTAITEDISLYL